MTQAKPETTWEIAEGSSGGLTDTADFVALLGRLSQTQADGRGDFFDAARGEFFDIGRELFVARAPGRLDVMGGIADYSGALVLQLPLACAAHVALQLRADCLLRVVSLSASEDAKTRTFEMSLEEFRDGARPLSYEAGASLFDDRRGGQGQRWAAYVAGAFLVLAHECGVRFARGASILIRSDVPEGKGVSSSAALEVATMRAVAAAYDVCLAPRELAFLCQRVENLIARAPCGVMDQMTSVCGEAGRLLALLCQPGELRGTFALPDELRVWGIDSGIRHAVGGGDYRVVRAAAFMGYRMIAEMAGLGWRKTERAGHVVVDDARWRGYLANVAPAEFAERYAPHLPECMTGAEFLERFGGITDDVTSVEPSRWYPVRQATAHPVSEHARVTKFLETLQAWQGNADSRALGELMYESHESYSACGLGSEGTDELVNIVRERGERAGLYGARITGGGSGGTVAVLARADAGRSVASVAAEYARCTERAPVVFSGSSPGAAAFGCLKLKRAT